MEKNKEFKALLWSYISIIIIPVIILGFLTIGILFKNLAKDTQTLSENILENTGSRVDAELEKILRLSYEICENDKVISFVNKYKESESISKYDELNLIKVLQMYKKNYNICTDVGIYLKKADMIITNEALCSQDEYYNIYLKGESFPYEKWIETIESSGLKNLFVSAGINDDGEKNIIYCRRFNDIKVNYDEIVFLSRINKDVVMSNLEFSGINEGTAFAMINRGGEFLFKTEEFDQKRNFEKSKIIYRDSKLLDCEYMYILPSVGLNGNVYTAMIVFLLVLIITIIASVLMAMWQSRRMQKSVLKVFDRNLVLENDLSYHTEIAKERAILNLLYNIKTEVSGQEKLETEFRSKGCNGFNVIAIASKQKENSEVYSRDIEVAFDEVNNIIGKKLSEKHIEYTFTRVGRQRYVCILGYRTEEFSRSNFQKSMEEFLKSYNIALCIGVGEETNNFSKLNISYETAMAALRFSINGSEKTFVCYDEIKKLENTKPYYTKEKEQSLLKNMKIGNIEETGKILNEIYTVNFEERQLSNLVLRRIVMNISMTICKVIDEVYDQEHISYETFVRECHNATRIEDFEESFSKLKSICKKICEEQANKDKKMVVKEKIERYISKNYGNISLSLEVVAEHIGMNYHYLSRAFTEYFGMSFTEYVTTIRLEKAKKLLKETDLKIDEIAKEIGFCEGTSLIRVFKKHFDVTPGKFRQQHK